MLLFRTLRLPDLIELCRSMRYPLNSGLTLVDVMDLLSNRGTARIRPVAARILKDLKSGWSLRDALVNVGNVLPPLFVSLATVGEETGNLPEVLAELEAYYTLRQKLRREFLDQISWPVLQFVAAVCVITVLIYVLGIIPAIPGPRGPQRLDPLGLGLVGARGAQVFFFSVAGALAGLALLSWAAKRFLGRRAAMERALLWVPVVGPCMRALAIARLCLAGRLMLETSLSILKTLRLAFVATDNAAFITRYPRVEASLRQGNSIASSFTQARLFPEKFLSAVSVGEESGKLPETLRYQADEYDDEARRRLSWMTRLGSWLVWLCVAVVILWCIFSIFTNVYVRNIEKVLPK
jgi:type IV pilus assembly protein PilC